MSTKRMSAKGRHFTGLRKRAASGSVVRREVTGSPPTALDLLFQKYAESPVWTDPKAAARFMGQCEHTAEKIQPRHTCSVCGKPACERCGALGEGMGPVRWVLVHRGWCASEGERRGLIVSSARKDLIADLSLLDEQDSHDGIGGHHKSPGPR